MRTALLVFIGGGLGSMARYFLGSWISKIYVHPFPLGTLTVNITACFLVGILAGLAGQRTSDSIVPPLLIIGFCGGFSTFSSFTIESARLASGNMSGLALVYIALSLIGCLAATFLGLWIAGRA